ncbi:MAG TPA: 3-deoxy-7-phosphoheptulonate synthase [Candidatus Hydrogenedentes bacterium]|nr:3-deoxy-7-phosphoheptulonate synthase [Candidatus Hydrogenedentota bacterium]HRK35147.1 3-deoxy-7-phosphoheptulonate synthase [Candidatus Hydrogenedentota bacterium]
MERTQDINVRSLTPLISPRNMKEFLPLSESACETVVRGREAIRSIHRREDTRLLVVVGPCSIHNEKSALEYAERLTAVAQRVHERFLVVMRVYFEKPRTTIGWKGLINDPHLDGSFDVSAGIHKAREILLRINEMGMPCATEMLDPITPQYTADLVTWASLGARTTESQTHRQMASGLSMPVGFKNGTDGNLQVAIDAMEAARHPHAFLGIDADGQTCIVNTNGNPDGQLILRGGRSGPNYGPESIAEARAALTKRNLEPHIVVDCSHANSNKDYRNQPAVFRNVLQQRIDGANDILGMMLESNLFEGSQPLGNDLNTLKYGVSITDSCIGWEQTESLLDEGCDLLTKAGGVAALSK